MFEEWYNINMSRIIHQAWILLAVFGALVATIAVFAQVPEVVNTASTDGRVAISGTVPKSMGTFRIFTDLAESMKPHTAVVGSIYEIVPEAFVLPFPVDLVFKYTDKDLVGHDPSDLSIAHWNKEIKRWELVDTTIDRENNTLSTSTRSLSKWALVWKESHEIPGEVLVLASKLLDNRPADMVGYTIDIEYAFVPNDYVLLFPHFMQDGCNGYIPGSSQSMIQDQVQVGEIFYRITLTWDLGDIDRCY